MKLAPSNNGNGHRNGNGASSPPLQRAHPVGWEQRFCELEWKLARSSEEIDRLQQVCRRLESENASHLSLLNRANIGWLYHDLSGRILKANRAAAVLLGHDSSALLRRPLTAFLNSREAQKFGTHLQNCCEHSGSVLPSLEVRSRLFGRVFVSLVSVPVFAENGQLDHIESALLDISHEMKAASNWRDSEQNLRALVESSPHPIQVKDAQGRWLLANTAALKLFGLDQRAYRHLTNAELSRLSPDCAKSLEACEQTEQLVLETGQTSRLNQVIPAADGSKRVVDFIRARVNDPHKNLIVLGYDITERQRTEELLRAQEAQLRFVTENISVMLTQCDARGEFLFVNRAFAAFIGLPADQILGRKISEILSAEAYQFVRPIVQRVLHGESLEYETQLAFRGSAESRFLRVVCTPQKDKRGKVFGWVASWTDITDLKKAELALREAANQLESQVCERTGALSRSNVALHREIDQHKQTSAAQRRLEKEVLRVSERERQRIAVDLHDGLSQELAGIWCVSEVLRKNLAAASLPDAATAGHISALLNSALAQTRDLARGLHPVQPEPNGLIAALKHFAETTSRLHNASCRLECARRVLVHDNDTATHLYRIAQEAVTNALRHGRARRISIHLTQRAGCIRLVVRDDGSGLQARLPTGRGMGLRIMAYRAEAIGGTMSVQRHPRGGTEAVCTLETKSSRKNLWPNKKTSAPAAPKES